jgi:Zn-dependent protease
MLDRGYLRVARPWGVELCIHWSLLATALLVARLHLEPVIWIGFFIVVLAHELGHAAAVACAGGTVLGLDATGLGGNCRWRGTGTLLERAWVAWGGILAQAVLLLSALLASALSGAALSPAGSAAQLEYCFVDVNLTVLAINLLPFAPLDGALGWRLFAELKASDWSLRQILRGGRRARREERRWQGPGAAAGEERAPPSSGAALGSGLAASAPGAPADPPALAPPYARARSTGGPRSERYGRATTGGAHHLDEESLASPRPSEQAQREIDALLRRMEDRAARSRRGR